MKEGTPDVTVHDHAHSVTAKYDDMLQESDLVAAFARELGEAAWDLEHVLVDPDLLASVVLNPGGFAKAEYELMDAVNGPRGLVGLAATLGLRGVRLATAVEVYQARDKALDALVEGTEWTLGYVAGATAPLWVPVAAAFTGAGLLLDHVATGGEGRRALVDWVKERSELAEHAVGALPGLLTGLSHLTDAFVPGPPISVYSLEEGAGLVALFLPDGTGVARHDRDLRPGAIDAAAPVYTLLDRLGDRNAEAGRRTRAGGAPVIDVTAVTVVNADGTTSRRWIVNIPGTSDILSLDGSVNTTNSRANVTAMTARDTAYQQAITEAMRQAGVRGDDAVMLVGHSLGGRVAVQLAGDLDGTYNVTHVLTAGSHVSDLTTPDDVYVLSLENSEDFVPRLDGDPNPVGPRRTTAEFTLRGHDTHGLDKSYLPGARGVDAERGQPALDEWRRSAGAYFGDPAPVTSVYEVSRVAP